MFRRKMTSFILIIMLGMFPSAVATQVDPGNAPALVLGVFDLAGIRLGAIVVAGQPGRGFEAGTEYWVFSERALLEIPKKKGLEIIQLAAGGWDDPWVMEALGWFPADNPIMWRHPTNVTWTKSGNREPPNVSGRAYFGNPTIGGLSVHYTREGRGSLTWFKLTAGAYMQLQDGAVLARENRPPSSASWWHRSIRPRH